MTVMGKESGHFVKGLLLLPMGMDYNC
jgi:hypothetical protein